MVNRFSVPNLYDCTKHLANVASRKIQPELILKNAHILSTYTNRILENKEIWISKGRIACIEENGQAEKTFNYKNLFYAFGHHHLGWTLGAITGKIIAGMLAGENTNLNLTPYSSLRFS